MDNERLILMLDAIRLEIRNLTLQSITANAIGNGAMSDDMLKIVNDENAALRQHSDQAARAALWHSS